MAFLRMNTAHLLSKMGTGVVREWKKFVVDEIVYFITRNKNDALRCEVKFNHFEK
jgi:hypothetical protein